MVFTNDNDDDTLASLGSFESGIGVVVDVLHERNVPGAKNERIAHGRNTLWKHLRELQLQPDYVLMLDLDGVCNDLEGLETCLELPVGWGGVLCESA